MWVVIAACRVGGRLLEPGEPLPDISADRIDRLKAARCIEWVEPVQKEAAALTGEMPPTTEKPRKRKKRK